MHHQDDKHKSKSFNNRTHPQCGRCFSSFKSTPQIKNCRCRVITSTSGQARKQTPSSPGLFSFQGYGSVMAATKRRPVWVIIPAKSLRRIGALKQSQPVQSFTASDGPAVSHSETSRDPIQQQQQQQQLSSQKQPPTNNNEKRSNVAAAVETPAGNFESGAPSVAIDNSTAAHCEVERRRKRKIATSIQTLAEMLQLKEVDPKKLAKADILKLALDQILKLKAANTELEENISKYAAQEKEESQQIESRQQFDDRLEELLVEHISLKKQLQQVSHLMSTKEKGGSVNCSTRRKQRRTSVDKQSEVDSVNSVGLVPFSNSTSQVSQGGELSRTTSGGICNDSRYSSEAVLPAESSEHTSEELVRRVPTNTEFTNDTPGKFVSVQKRSVRLSNSCDDPDTGQDSGGEVGSNDDDVMVVESTIDRGVCSPASLCRQFEEPAVADDQYNHLERQTKTVELCESLNISDQIESTESGADSKLCLADICGDEESKDSSSVEMSGEFVLSAEVMSDFSSDAAVLSSSSCVRVLNNTPPGVGVSNKSPSCARVLTNTVHDKNNSCDSRALYCNSPNAKVSNNSPLDAGVSNDPLSDVRVLNDPPLDVGVCSLTSSQDPHDCDTEVPEKSPSWKVLKEPVHDAEILDDTCPLLPVTPTITDLNTLQQPTLSSTCGEEALLIEAEESSVHREPCVVGAAVERNEVTNVRQHQESIPAAARVVSALGNVSCDPDTIPMSNPTTIIAGGVIVTCAVASADSPNSLSETHSPSPLSPSSPPGISEQPALSLALNSSPFTMSSSLIPAPSHQVVSSSSSSKTTQVSSSNVGGVHHNEPLTQPWPVSSLLHSDNNTSSSIPMSCSKRTNSSISCSSATNASIPMSCSRHTNSSIPTPGSSDTNSSISGSSAANSSIRTPGFSENNSSIPISGSSGTNFSISMPGSNDSGVSIHTSISNDWLFAPVSNVHNQHSELAPVPSSSSIPNTETSSESSHFAITSSVDRHNPSWTTCISTGSSRKRKSKSMVDGSKQDREEGHMGGATLRKAARTSKESVAHQQGTNLLNDGLATQLSCVMSAESSDSCPSLSSRRIVGHNTNMACAQVSVPQPVDFRHCRTFTDSDPSAQSTHPASPTSSHPAPPTSSHPAPPTSSHPAPPTFSHPAPPTSTYSAQATLLAPPTSAWSTHPAPPTLPVPPTSAWSTHLAPPFSTLSTPLPPTSDQSARPALSTSSAWYTRPAPPISAQVTHPAPPTSAQSTYPAHPTPPSNQHSGQDLHLYGHQRNHQHQPSSVIVQPWIDHSHNQIDSTHFARPPQYGIGRARSGRSTPGNIDQRRMDRCRQWNNTSGHLQPPSDPDMPHLIPPPPSQLLVPPHQHLYPHHQTLPPHFPSPDFDPWSQGVHGDTLHTNGNGWASRSTHPSSSYLQYGTNLQAPTVGGGGVANGRQWRACSSQQQRHHHHTAGFMADDHMNCESMSTSPFPGVWRPYSETNHHLPAPPPSREAYCGSESATQSQQQLHFPFLDPCAPSSSRQLFSDHEEVSQLSRPQNLATENTSNHPSRMGRASGHQQTHYLQMEHAPSPSCSGEGAPPANQHPLQLEPTQPSSRTESFFVDRLLYDIG